MKVVLTGHGAFADEYLRQYKAEIVSLRSKDVADYADIIIHNAAKINCCDDIDAINANIKPTEFLLSQIKNQKLIYLSSMSVIDDSINTPYSRSKKYCEYMVLSEVKNAVVVRFSTIFYANKEKDALSRMIYNAIKYDSVNLIGTGSGKRDWLPLADAVKTVHSLISKSGVFTLASGQATSFLDLARIIQDLRPEVKINFSAGEEKSVLCDFEKTVDVNLKEVIKCNLAER